jgi:hypothetical protein
MSWFNTFSTIKYYYSDPVAVRFEVYASNANTVDREFEFRLGQGRLTLSFNVIFSSVGKGLAASWSLDQGALPM